MTMEYLRGGDLRYHLCFYEFFNEEQTSIPLSIVEFIAGCIILALEYTHSKGIIHRDLKPENLVFEENGYLRITDFGVARRKKESNSEETSGTPGYMAPEVICRMNHSFEVDFFALGVIIYEMMMGSVRFKPFRDPIWEKLVRKLEIKFLLIKLKFQRKSFR
jgi:serine/threonine protein kinase